MPSSDTIQLWTFKPELRHSLRFAVH